MKSVLQGVILVYLLTIGLILSTQQAFAHSAHRATDSSKDLSRLSKINVVDAQNQVRLSTSTLKAGEVAMVIHNKVAKPNEFLLLKSDLPLSQLPSNFKQLDTAAGVQPIVDEFESAKQITDLAVNLAPGHYIVEFKPLSGSRTAITEFTVKAAV